MSILGRLMEPNVEAFLLVDEGEKIIDEVRKHWAASFWWYCLAALSLPLFISMFWFAEFFWVPILAGLAALAVGIWKIHVNYMDRFVITNMRVFRVHGVLSTNLATMPMSRILDITMHQPFVGMLFGYGHFVFETAAQDQGLRDITFVAQPEKRDLTIQRVIARAGLRTKMRMDDEDDDGS
ncbi:MAG: PH domain-containing protein [Propionibacteriaceae bacterium]|nr:PH domain-containing protein [Propionibacteriaceae bacterium]